MKTNKHRPDFTYANTWHNRKRRMVKTRMDRKIKKREAEECWRTAWMRKQRPIASFSLSLSGCFLWMLLRSAVMHLFWWRLRSVNWEVGGYPTPCTLWILCLLATPRNTRASLSLRRRASDGVQDWFVGAEVWFTVQGTPTLPGAGVSPPPAYACFHGSGRSPHMAQVGGSACDTITLPVG